MEKKNDFDRLLQIVQLLVILAGVAGFFIEIGKTTSILSRTTNDISELKLIVQDLLKAQIQVSSTDARHSALLEDLKQRVLELERRKP